ncbi:STE3-domain-containing protein [Dentipellis sp. KUC8613]|nr:STE3-domain-containing protein [Dentipellis sp. KUC8613]
MSTDPSYPAFPVFAFIGIFLVLIPLPWHLQAWNSGTCLYMFWVSIACLNLFVNSIIWHGNALDWAPVWCDISSRLVVGVAVAIPAASLCINRRLYLITSVQNVTITRAEKRRAVIIDLSIGLGIPILQMILQIIVEGHRYNILEDIGCYPFTFNTPLAYPLTIIWPIVIGLVSSCYCALTLRSFFRRRAQFSEFVTSHSSLTIHRYFRLMALAMTDVLFTVPISAYGIYLNATANSMSPWRGWADAHFDYSNVDQIPAAIWRTNYSNELSIELSRWAVPFSAFVFFGFFGFALEARKNYGKAFWTVAKILGRIKPSRLPASNTFKCLQRREAAVATNAHYWQSTLLRHAISASTKTQLSAVPIWSALG